VSQQTDTEPKVPPTFWQSVRTFSQKPAVAGTIQFLGLVLATIRDLAPIIAVIALFQLLVLNQSFPDIEEVVVGLLFVMLGLALFVKGLEMGLFPLGDSLARDFTTKGSLFWMLAFAFALGFGTTVAEPALIAVSAEAARTAAEAGFTGASEEAQTTYAFSLRYTVAVSVGAGITLGVFRILKGWPVHWLIIGGYLLMIVLTFFAPDEIIGIAYDSGSVTTSTITVPLVTALGVGLSTMIRGRNPLIDGFGLIAFASLMPIIFVLVMGMVY
jgi:hypothetical protein